MFSQMSPREEKNKSDLYWVVFSLNQGVFSRVALFVPRFHITDGRFLPKCGSFISKRILSFLNLKNKLDMVFTLTTKSG